MLSIHSQERNIVNNVYKKLLEKKQSGNESISLHNISKLTSQLTGISESSITRITREGRSSSGFRSPKKNKPKNKKKIQLDDFDLCVIRRKIHEFYTVKKEVPTLKKLLAVLKEDINFPGGRELLRLILKKLGYKFKKCRNQRQILITWREKYLDEIDNARRQKMPIVYLDELYIHTSLNHNKCWQSNEEPGVSKSVATGKRYIMVHAGGATGFVPNALLLYNDKEKKSDYHDSMNKDNFKKWVLEKLLPNLNQNSCVVMDNARYHSYQINKAPNTSWKKASIQKWLDNIVNIVMLNVAKLNKPLPKYEIDDILKDHGHTVLRLLPYHCDFNPIEMIWGILKGKVASKNVSHGGDGFLHLVQNSFEEITTETWKNCCDHVIKIENYYRKSDHIIDSHVEKFVIEVDSESDTSDSSDSESDFNKSLSGSEFETTCLMGTEYLDSDFDYGE